MTRNYELVKGRQTPLDLAWNVRLGVWGTDVTMTRNVASVRQNLTPLVTGGRPTPMVATRTWRWWGSTCSATSCGRGLPGAEHQWRAGLGITADGALVYTAGPGLAAPSSGSRLLASTDH